MRLSIPATDTSLRSNFLNHKLHYPTHSHAKMDAIPVIHDKWASPTTQAFAFIGILWVSLKILSFWRLIASLFILPGISVCT